MSNNGTDQHEDRHVLAATYVLGLLDDTERDAFEARLDHDAELRQALAVERERFLELDSAAPEAEADEALWQRIEKALISMPATVTNIETKRTASRSARAAPATATAGGGFWRGFAAASIMAVIIGAIGYATLRPAEPRLVVVLLNEKAEPVSIVEAYGGQRVRILPLADIAVPEGKTLQVWTLPDKTTGPVSIGLMPRAGATTLDGPVLPAPRPDQLYEITIEPAGGSPTGKPTGPIVGKGFARIPQI